MAPWVIDAPSAPGGTVPPEPKYARLGEDRIAYQVLGQGPPDLVITTGTLGSIDSVWEEPGVALFFRRLASFSRLILFDRLGSGVSDPLPPDPLPPWEAHAEALDAVLEAVGSERTAIMAHGEVGPMALLFAVTRPERTSALILANTSAKYLTADDYPIGVPREVAEQLITQADQLWGSEALAAVYTPSRAQDQRFLAWHAGVLRAIASPRRLQTYLRAALETDARPLLPLVQAPTLVLHRHDHGFIPIEHARYLAEHLPRAKLVELPGADALLVWETPELALDQVEEFLTGIQRAAEPRRVLATVLFTDVVDSTRQASRVGDRRWRDLLDVHDELARRLVEEAGGRVVKTTGDGILATFDGPGRGIRCAATLRDELGRIGLQVRADCTPARSSCASRTSAASPCTSRPG
jgi:pimeloyl-ACP methyl ester carboxylesterase